MSTRQRLLAIVEMGGYPNFMPLYAELGFDVEVVNSLRKARNSLKQQIPDLVVAEYNFQSQFRDRTSNLETLMAVLQRHAGCKVVVFYDPAHAHKFALLKERFAIFAALTFPVTRDALQAVLVSAGPEVAA